MAFTLSGGAGFCNAVRRTILSDTKGWAPHSLTIRTNTSCHTDEYLAHRVGMIPFRRTGAGTEMTLDARGPCVVCARDVVGIPFAPMHDAIEILTLGADQAVDATVHFEEHTAGTHARYSPCAAVGMKKLDGEGRHQLTFELLNDNATPKDVLHAALDALDASLDDALLQLGNQPDPPPRTRC